MGSLRAARLGCLALLSCALGALSAVSARAWQTTIEGQQGAEDWVSAMKLSADGNVVVAGALDAESSTHWLTAKLAGATGAMLWRREFGPAGYRYSFPHDLDVTAQGDAVAAGPFTEGVTGVRRFSGPTGSPLWETTLSRTLGWVEDVLIDPSGDVLVGGHVYDRYPIADMAVVKIDGATGTELWTRVFVGPGNSGAKDLSVDSNGDVVVGGTMQDGTDCPSFAVLKLSGSDGSEVWRRVIPGPVTCGGYASLVAVDAAGDVVAGGAVTDAYTNLFVTKLSGSDGAEVWRYHLQRSVSGTFGATLGLSLLSSEDAVISGRVRPDPGLGEALRVARLRGSDGAELWTNDLRGSDPLVSSTQVYPGDSLIAIGPASEIVVGDSLTNQVTGRDFAVMKLHPETGAEIWRFTHDAGASSADDVRAVAIGAGGQVFAAGNTYGNRGIKVLKLDGATGSPVQPACQNGIDDDEDSAVDFPADRDCASADDAFETADCADGIDNDGDGKIDYGLMASNDPGCRNGRPKALENPQCSNGIDDDADGAIDHPADPQCAHPWGDTEAWLPPSCGLGGLEVLLPLLALWRVGRRRRVGG